MLTYRDSDHSYFLDGRQIPGITRILADLGAYPGSGFYTEESQRRGQAGHLACQLADTHCPKALTLDDALDTLAVSDALVPYLSEYLRFKRETGYRADDWEVPVWSRKLRVAGRPDTYGRMTFSDGPLAVVDVKTWENQGAKPKHSSEVQTAFYAIGIADKLGIDPHEIERYVLKLPGDGNYRLYYCDNVNDFYEAEWASRLWWSWHEHGIFKFAGDPEETTTGE